MSLRYICIGSAHYSLQSQNPASSSTALQNPSARDIHDIEMKPQAAPSAIGGKPLITILAEYPTANDGSPSPSSFTPQNSALQSLPGSANSPSYPAANMIKKIFDSLIFESVDSYTKETHGFSSGMLPSPRARMIEDSRSNWNYFYLASPSFASMTNLTAIEGNGAAAHTATNNVSDGRLIVGCVTTSDVRKRTAEGFLDQVLAAVCSAVDHEAINETGHTFRYEFQAISKLQSVLKDYSNSFATFGGVGNSNQNQNNGSRTSNFMQNVLHNLVSTPARHQKLTAMDNDGFSVRQHERTSQVNRGGSKYNSVASLDVDDDEVDHENDFNEGLVELRKQHQQRDLQVIYPRHSSPSSHTTTTSNQTSALVVPPGISDPDLLQANTTEVRTVSGLCIRRRRIVIAVTVIAIMIGMLAVVVYFLFFRLRTVEISYDAVVAPPMR